MDQGVIHSLKQYFRKRLVLNILQKFNEKLSNVKANEVSNDVKTNESSNDVKMKQIQVI